MADPKWKKLQWKLEYVDAKGKIKRLKAGQAASLEAKTYFAVRGRPLKGFPFLYVVSVDEDGDQTLRLSMLALAEELDAAPGREVRLPQPGTFLFNENEAAVSVLALDRALPRAELAKLIGAREPDPIKTKEDTT
jgi:hypothetical protein